MKFETIKWIDDCKKCGAVYNAKKIYEDMDPVQANCADMFLKEFSYVPWECPRCKMHNQLNN